MSYLGLEFRLPWSDSGASKWEASFPTSWLYCPAFARWRKPLRILGLHHLDLVKTLLLKCSIFLRYFLRLRGGGIVVSLVNILNDRPPLLRLSPPRWPSCRQIWLRKMEHRRGGDHVHFGRWSSRPCGELVHNINVVLHIPILGIAWCLVLGQTLKWPYLLYRLSIATRLNKSGNTSFSFPAWGAIPLHPSMQLQCNTIQPIFASPRNCQVV